MPGLPNRTLAPPPPNVTMGHHSSSMMMGRQQEPAGGSWNSNSNCLGWSSGSLSVSSLSAVANEAPVRQNYDVIARRRNPHYWTIPNGSGITQSSSSASSSLSLINQQNGFVASATSNCNSLSPLTPTPTPSPATPSPISPAYPNRPLSVVSRHA